jgi:hypothetical protein
VSELDERAKQALKKLLMEHNPAMWENSTDELKQALA